MIQEQKPPNIWQSLSRSFSQPQNIFLLHSPCISLSRAIARATYHTQSRLILIIDADQTLLQEINFYLHLIKQDYVLGRNDIRADSPQVVSLNKVIKEKRGKYYLEGGIYSLTLRIILLDILSPEKNLNPQDIDRIIIIHQGHSIPDHYCYPVWLTTLLSLNRNTAKIVFSTQFPQLFKGNQLEDSIRWLFMKKVVVWPFGRNQIHSSLKAKPLCTQSHKLIMNNTQMELHDLYCQLLKFSEANSKEQRGIQYLQSLLINQSKLNYYTRAQRMIDDSYDGSIWKSSNSRVMDLVELIRKKSKSCLYNLILNKNQEGQILKRKIDLTQFFEANYLDQKLQQNKNKGEDGEIRKGDVLYELTYELWVVGRDSLEHNQSPLFPPKFLHLMQTVISSSNEAEITKMEGQKEKGDNKNSFQQFQFSEEGIKGQDQYLKLMMEREPALSTDIYVAVNSEDLGKCLSKLVSIYRQGDHYIEYLRELLRFLEIGREFRLAAIEKTMLQAINPNQKNKFSSDKLKIYEQQPILVEELYQELRTVDEMILHYSINNDDDQLANNYQKQLEKRQFRYLNKNGLRKLPKRRKDLDPTVLTAKDGHQLRFYFQKTLSIYELAQHLRVLSPEICVFYNPNPSFIRNISIAYSQNEIKSLKDLHMIYFEKSIEYDRVQAGVKEEDQAFWNIAQTRKKLGLYSEQPQLRIRELIIDDDLHKKAKMISMADGLSKMKKGNQDSQLPHWVNPQKLFRVKVERTILIDKRQFKSMLPSYLYHYGFTIIPVFLDSADYIISNEVAIEKKSVQTRDLHQSLRSGRLNDQARKMTHRFSRPYLLVECSQKSYFKASEFNSNVNQSTGERFNSNTMRQVAQLLVNHPKLGVIWSSGYLQTVEYFMELKKNQIDPDLNKFRPQSENEPDDLYGAQDPQSQKDQF